MSVVEEFASAWASGFHRVLARQRMVFEEGVYGNISNESLDSFLS